MMYDPEKDKAVVATLDGLSARLDASLEQMGDPAVATNGDKLAELGREQRKLSRVVEPFRRFRALLAAIDETRTLIDDPEQEADFRAMAREEIVQLEQQANELFESVKEALVVSDDASVASVILEIRAGTGGDEAALFARDLFEMYRRCAETKGYGWDVLEASPTELGGFKEVVVNVKGDGVYGVLGYEGGGHRVQRVPTTETQGRIHTSAATVAVLPEAESVDIEIDWNKDVVEHVSRAGGPGGQNVNKVSSAIRLEHPATGITVSMRDEKSQHKNRAKARKILAARLLDHHQSKIDAQRSQARRTMIGSGDRSQRIRTYNYPQNRVTDHRIGLDLYKLEAILQGELDELIDALRAHDKAQRLANL
jgi:peptide chain release factor 1